MNPTTTVTLEVRSLIEAVCDGMADDAQVRDLESLLLTDEETRNFYVDLLDLDAKLQRLVGSLQEGDVALKEFIAVKQTPPQELAPLTSFLPLHGTFGYFSSEWTVSYLIATVIMGIGALIMGFTHVSHPVQVAQQSDTIHYPLSTIHSDSVVGRITGMVDCKWEKKAEGGGRRAEENLKSEIQNLKSFVSLGQKFALRSGFLEITYDSGAKVILQGPVQYEVESKDGGFLSLGKLTARVEKKAEEVASGQWSVVSNPPSALRPPPSSNPQSLIPNPSSLSTIHHPLFTIKTPTATVTDLGTEFGVEVSKEGNTTSHVYRGSVRLQVTSSDGKAEGSDRVLHENESACVESGGNLGDAKRIKILEQSDQSAAFVREIPKRMIKTLSLADVVAGGDGFSNRRNRGIDPRNGRVNGETTDDSLVGDGKYHRVDGMPLVDGVFIPCSDHGPVQLDSAGHAFAEFTATENKTSGLVFAGKEGDNGTELDGVDYNSPGHGMIAMHANKGVTFDLEAIRRANPGCKLLRFRGVAGLPAPTTQAESLVTNGNFTAGVDGWSARGSGTFTVDTSSADGHNGLITGQCELAWDLAAFSLQEGQQFDVSFMAASPDATAINDAAGRALTVRLAWVEGDWDWTSNNYIPSDVVVKADQMNAGWATYTATFGPMPAGHKGSHPILLFDSAAGSPATSHYAVDNVVFRVSQSQGCDFLVFVDGEARFKRRQVNSYSGAMPAVVPIKDSDRFLTLAATDGGDGISMDFTMFGDPRIEMTSVKTAIDSTLPSVKAEH